MHSCSFIVHMKSPTGVRCVVPSAQATDREACWKRCILSCTIIDRGENGHTHHSTTRSTSGARASAASAPSLPTCLLQALLDLADAMFLQLVDIEAHFLFLSKNDTELLAFLLKDSVFVTQ